MTDEWECKICGTRFLLKESHGCMNKESDWLPVRIENPDEKISKEVSEDD